MTLKGRYVTVEPYVRAEHLQALWDGLGGMGVNPLLLYFAQDDFAGIDDFAKWLENAYTKSGWLTHIFRDTSTGMIVGMANYMRADPANGVVEIGGVAHGPDMKRSPLSTEAHYLMAKHVFEDLGYRRYEWKCDNNNEASKTTAARYGFKLRRCLSSAYDLQAPQPRHGLVLDDRQRVAADQRGFRDLAFAGELRRPRQAAPAPAGYPFRS